MAMTDSLANLIGDAVTDIRRRVVEEPWYGRAVTTRGDFGQMIKELYGEPSQETAARAQSIDLDR